MTKQFYKFSVLVLNHDRDLMSMNPDISYQLILKAHEAKQETTLTDEQWVKAEFDNWVKSPDFIYKSVGV
jgi:hypothetical protein